ncbi:MAG: serine hydrolase domain-containing protein, partial [Acidobacteriota bacterium]
MIRCVTVGVLGLFLLTPSWASGPEEAFTEAWARFEREHLASAERSGMVGSAALFMHGGKTLGVSGQGYSDLASMTPVTRDTIFHWASCTKMFTGIAIMQLRDRGALSLDDPIVKYLPELRQVHNPFGSMDAITLDHLLTHSAGFRAGTWPWMDKEWQDQPRHWSQIVAMLPYTEVLFEPGSQYGYSNPGVIFLGRVIEILSGDDYEVYVDKNILKPLGMHDAFFDNTPYYLEGRRSRVYFSKNGESTDGGSDFDAGITVSNGGLNASLRDMARFAAFLAGGPGAGDPERHRLVLERSSLEAMWERR